MCNGNIQSHYDSRKSRNEFIAKSLSKYIGKSVLNVGGGGQRYLSDFLSDDVIYKELDITGESDYKIDLENEVIDILDNSFETVICTEVLEHLDNFHEVYFELIRLSSKWVIISLPNAISIVDPYFIESKAVTSDKAGITRGKFMKFYGLPIKKPDDRHKWFFSYSEAKYFLEYYSESIGFDIVKMFPAGISVSG